MAEWHSDGVTGLRTGLSRLDRATTGLHPGELVIVAAPSSMGKTSLGTQIAEFTGTCTRRPALIFTLEMPRKQILERILCSRARIDGKHLRAGQLSRHEEARLRSEIDTITSAPIWVDDEPGLSLAELGGRARWLKAQLGDLAVVVVDYVQLMRAGSDVAEISRGLKALAMELDVPVVALSQLHRKDRRPMTSDLRESGAIEQDADAIWFIYRDEVYNPTSQDRGVAEIIVGKNRFGPTTTIRTRYFDAWTTFADLEDDARYSSGEFADA